MRTFGYEAEFQTNATLAYRALNREGLTPTTDMHRWHCDCSNCGFGGARFPFRGQTDSSCSGEIISSINTIDGDTFDMDEAWIPNGQGGRMGSRAAMAALQEAAVEHDAEPGTRSGFHVHVGVDHLDEAQKIKAVYNLCRWEELLYELAAGSLPHGLRNENQRYQTQHLMLARDRLNMETNNGNPHADIVDGWQTDLRDGYRIRRAGNLEIDYHLYQIALGADRHSSLNLRTGHGTWEYRLWNSTRSAWRMEMFCSLSLAMVEPGVIAAMADVPDDELSLDHFEEILRTNIHTDVVELVQRQRALSIDTVPRFTQLVTT